MTASTTAKNKKTRKAEAVSIAISVLLVIIGSVRIVSTYAVFNHTIDEPAHLAAGMEWIEGKRYTYEDQHPPLARVFAALGPHLAGVHWTRDPNMWYEGFHLLGHGTHYTKTLVTGRLGILPFFWLGAAVVFLWALRSGSWLGAATATCLYTTTPPILAHAGLMTTDMALAACVGVTVLASISWAQTPNLRTSAVFGFFFGLALLSKFSALLFLPSAWLLMWLAHAAWLRFRGGKLFPEVREHARFAWLALFVAALVVWAGYRFTFHRVAFLHMRLPAPAFFSGIHSLLQKDAELRNVYLLGELRPGAFWYFFPVVLAVKTPMAMLILVGLAAWFAFRFRDKIALTMPLAFSAAILLSSLVTRIQLGVRHILPIYIGLSVAGGVVAARFLKSAGLLPRIAIATLICWQVVSGALQHPDYIAYMNEFGDGHPERVLADSDVDWGQDMMRLGKRLGQLDVKSITFQVFNKGYLLTGYPFPPINDLPPGNTPPPGWTAISVTSWKLNGTPEWANHIRPAERIGRSIFLYYVPSQHP